MPQTHVCLQDGLFLTKLSRAADISAILSPLASQLLEAIGTYSPSHPLESLVSKYLRFPCSGQGVDLD